MFAALLKSQTPFLLRLHLSLNRSYSVSFIHITNTFPKSLVIRNTVAATDAFVHVKQEHVFFFKLRLMCQMQVLLSISGFLYDVNFVLPHVMKYLHL